MSGTTETARGMIFTPHPRQELVLTCPAQEILYGGSAGAGKSWLLLFAWLQHQAQWGWKAKGLLLRKTNPELEFLIEEFKKVFSALPDPPKWNETKKTFTHSGGATLRMGFLDVEDDQYRYHGDAYTQMYWDEITLWDNDKSYTFLLTRLRSPHGVPCQVICTTNPIGVGVSWVMDRWKIDQFPNGMVPINLYTDRTKGTVFEGHPDWDKLPYEIDLPTGVKKWTRIFIPGKLADNPSLDYDGAYRAQLMMKPEKLRQALLDGRWDAIEGCFFDEWEPSVHVTKAFNPQNSGRKWMALDWGTARPYAVLWGWDAPNGEIYVYDELYGWGGAPDKGTMETASMVAQKIVAREKDRGDYIIERYMDPSCFSKDGHEISIADIFAKQGVIFQAGPRRNKEGRVALIREKLKVVNKTSQLKIMDNCTHLIRTLPRLQFDPNNPELYDKRGEDHCADCISYLLYRNRGEKNDKKTDIAAINRARLSRYGEFGAY